MRVAIRADASLLIGTGHITRCKTLADALQARGAEVRFVCREHPGHLILLLREAGWALAETRDRGLVGSEETFSALAAFLDRITTTPVAPCLTRGWANSPRYLRETTPPINHASLDYLPRSMRISIRVSIS